MFNQQWNLCQMFQSTSPRGGRPPKTAPATPTITGFNPRPHEGDDHPLQFTGGKFRVSIHVPTRGTTWGFQVAQQKQPVSIHVPTRGTTEDTFSWSGSGKFQSTSPRGGRHFCIIKVVQKHFVSIHVPTRGTTHLWERLKEQDKVSIHVPTRGTTKPWWNAVHFVFVSIHVPTRGTTGNVYTPNAQDEVSIHVPTRGTTVQAERDQSSTKVSIHVPTRGTTRATEYYDSNNNSFNPRPHEGDDVSFQGMIIDFGEFQSTSPRGGRRCKIEHICAIEYGFNPRPHEGDDDNIGAVAQCIKVSIHVPTRGTTCVRCSTN